MSVDDNVLRIAREMRLNLNGIVDDTVRALVRSWATAWDELAGEWDLAALDLASAASGGWPTRGQILRMQRVDTALDLTFRELDRLAREAGVTIIDPLGEVVTSAAGAQARIVAAQMPPVMGAVAALTARFDRVDPLALAAIVSRTTSQVTSLLHPLSTQAASALHASLIRGVALGENPRETAARLVRRLEGDFNGGLNRALTVARTEMLDAHRAGAKAQDLANLDVVAGWEWLATFDTRTCPSCLAMHGTRFPPDVDGPEDHQQGRCARVTVTKTWRELGFDLDEPKSTMPDARAWFDGLSDGEKGQILGPGKLELLQSGKIQWSDLATKRSTTGWRDSYAPTSLRDLQAKAAAGSGRVVP